jgi:hypothetical protein
MAHSCNPRRNSQRAVGILVCAVSERGVQHAPAATAAAMAMELARSPRQTLQLPERTPARPPICSFPPYPSVRLPVCPFLPSRIVILPPVRLPIVFTIYCNCFLLLLPAVVATAVTIQFWDLDQCHFIFLLLLLFYY